ncbi:MAG: M56 family metallopeptidase [Oscillibacter sp.]|jgi:beta-lactamase regulating signal transducer with metallopeptidase domain|nr:M56 family metallopeptidase [Oscillibacter sp.]
MENLTSVVRSLFSLSLTALPVMAAVLLARWLLLQCNAPKKYAFVLWGLVGFRLCCPITLSSMFSIFNAVRPVADITVPTSARNFSTVTFGGGALSSQSRAVLDATSLSENSVAASLTPTELALRVAAIIWLIGLAAILIYSVISLLLLRRRLAEATRMEDNIYECDAIPTPFVLGWIRPKIYLPCRTGAEERNYILLHERTHLRRGDPWWKLIGFLILAVYWWNPTAWLCWALMIRDMEMACDEAVIHTLGPDAKQGYSLSLVNFASARRFSTAAPLAFGENDAKSRIKNVLRWKQTRAGVVFLSVALAAILIVACCTNANVKDSSTLTYADGQYSYSLGSDVRSMMLYYEVCTNGTMVSHDQIINENVGSDFPRNGSFSLGFTPQRENEHGTWRSFDWNYSDSSGASLSVSYTLNTSFRGYSSNTPDQPLDNLSMGEQTVDTVIQAHILDTNGDNGASGYSIHTYEETGAAENISVDGDAVVLVHLVLSPGDAIQLA